jgi:hypothetical protein
MGAASLYLDCETVCPQIGPMSAAVLEFVEFGVSTKMPGCRPIPNSSALDFRKRRRAYGLFQLSLEIDFLVGEA